MSAFSPFRIKLWTVHGTHRGRLNLVSVIDDAGDIGVSGYANHAGEMYFTLPMNHPQIDQVVPLQRHWEVSRRNTSGTYDILGKGLLEDYDATGDEVVFYGIDYLGLFTKSITANNQSYSSTLIGNIISTQFTAFRAASDSPIGFLGTGLINTTSRTVTVVTSFEERLAFWRGLTEILQGSGTTRPILNIDITQDPPDFFFVANYGSDRQVLRLEYGAGVLDFRYRLGTTNLATTNRAIGLKREGASALYSTQTYGVTGTYGDLQMSALYTDLINQAELDSRALAELRDRYDRGGSLYVSLTQNQIARTLPNIHWFIGDSMPVVIDRGIVSINALYTAWGYEWIGRRDGSESLFIDLQPKLV